MGRLSDQQQVGAQVRTSQWGGVRAAACCVALAVGWACALLGQSAVAQVLPVPPVSPQDAQERRRAEERDGQLRERLQPLREAEPGAIDGPLNARLPEAESPCFVIDHVELNGDGHDQFAWVLDHLAGPDGLDGPQGRCLGSAGVLLVVQRAQNALVQRGFVTSRALVAPQELGAGRLVITLVPGRIRRVVFDDPVPGRANAANALPARAGDLLNLRDIEQALENFKRVPTVEADIRIEPAPEPGLSDLHIRWTQGLPVRLSLTLDDAGSKGTGRYQTSASLSLDNPLALNDLFYIGIQGDLGGGDPGRRGTSGRSLHYSVPFGHYLLALDLGRNGYHQSVAGASQDYTYRGTSESQGVTLTRLLHRGADHKTSVQFQFFARQSRNFIDDTEIEVQRRRVGGWQLGVGHRAHLGAGTLDLNLSHRRGTGAFNALRAPEEAFDEGTSRFVLWQADARWQWPFRWGDQPLRYSGQWRAQINRTPLSPQERFAIGGRHTVRGFDGESSLSADRGWLLRQEVAVPLADSGQAFFIGLDHGQVDGPSADRLVGTRLTGAVLGMRGNVSALQYEWFAGWPLHRPDGFRTENTALGFLLSADF